MSRLSIGEGNVVDNSADTIHMKVEDMGDTSKLTFVLKAANNVTWWKHLAIFQNYLVFFPRIHELETVNNNREASVDIIQSQFVDNLLLQFWKAGFLGAGAYVHGMALDLSDNLGLKVTFTWTKDD